MTTLPKLFRQLMLATSATLLCLPHGALAQAWPSKLVRVVLPVAPGGATDASTRFLQGALSEALGQPIIIENKPGAGGITATDAVAHATDGHTFGLVNSPHATNVTMQPKLPYDTTKDLVPVGFVWRAQSAISVHPSTAAKSLSELVRIAKSAPVSYGTPGIGFSMHLAGELLKMMSGAEFSHVPYRGAGPALNDALGGLIPMVISNVASSAPHARAGKLRALAVTGAERSPLLPNVPTVAEQGYPGFEITEWLVAIAPRGTPAAAVERFSAALNKVLASSEVAQKFSALGLEIDRKSPAETEKFVAAEITKLAAIVRKANVKPE